MKTLRILLLVACAGVLAACGSKLTPENFARVKSGMTEEEVRDILGKPDQLEGGELLGLSSSTYTYHNEGSVATIGFINGKVTLKNIGPDSTGKTAK
jgi:hypothetical protein